ncbi:hypothetical protein SLEP1_g37953 [Rubroshorea leprosula]|uniref:Uncharacterized protein n=1 Tax=Rubroshorea leprosula TaxID=152421 RepID=A0AAV5KWC4_9ROSI|nr:hypothetical protein SLEP1_g37953 [Rubroshorea leprosula]
MQMQNPDRSEEEKGEEGEERERKSKNQGWMTDKLEDPVSLDEEISLEAEETVGEFEFVIFLHEEISLEAGESVYKVSKEDMMDKFKECMIYTLAAKERFYKAIADRYRTAGTAISSDDRFSILECICILQIMKGISYSTAREAINAFKNSL